MADICVWSLSNDDSFLVNSVRKHIDEHSLPSLFSCTRWYKMIPKKTLIRFLAWNNITFNSHSMRKCDILDFIRNVSFSWLKYRAVLAVLITGASQSRQHDLLNEVTKVQTVFNQMEAVVQQYFVDKQCFEIQKNQFLIEDDRLWDQVISQDIVNIVVNSSLDINTSVNVNSSVAMNDSVNYVEMCNKILELEA
nr:RNA-directed DNA polymerase, eukaryota, reverse transcriptase zinc-binding domain protein [Tanacetum cinerariifolium]